MRKIYTLENNKYLVDVSTKCRFSGEFKTPEKVEFNSRNLLLLLPASLVEEDEMNNLKYYSFQKNIGSFEFKTTKKGRKLLEVKEGNRYSFSIQEGSGDVSHDEIERRLVEWATSHKEGFRPDVRIRTPGNDQPRRVALTSFSA